MSQPQRPETGQSANGPALKRSGWFYAVVILIIVVVPIAWNLLLSQIQHIRDQSRKPQCKTHLKQLGLAFHNYHDEYGCFPPAYVADAEGRPMHSWRVLLLPFLDRKPLYDEYCFDEPWDGPNNRKLADRMVGVYSCPQANAQEGSPESLFTSYVAVVGPETAFPGTASTSVSDMKDGTANTLLLVEVTNSGIHWMEPRDLHVVQMSREINGKAGQGISGLHEAARMF